MPDESNRKLIVIRHGERVDAVFDEETSGDWVKKAFEPDGTYNRYHDNLPESLPNRSDGFASYQKDTPLTKSGYADAVAFGAKMRSLHPELIPDRIFVSPALRCIQTCAALLRGLGKDMEFHVEPALLEVFMRVGVPPTIEPHELARHGFSVDVGYEPHMDISSLKPEEPAVSVYERSHRFVQTVLHMYPNDKTIWMVGHSASLDLCTRRLTGRRTLESQEEFWEFLKKVPWRAFLSTAMAAEDSKSGNWAIVEPPHPPSEQLRRMGYNWKYFADS